MDSVESQNTGPKDSAELVLMSNGKRQWGSPNGLVEFSFQKGLNLVFIAQLTA
jgi:hypothetical protein